MKVKLRKRKPAPIAAEQVTINILAQKQFKYGLPKSVICDRPSVAPFTNEERNYHCAAMAVKAIVKGILLNNKSKLSLKTRLKVVQELLEFPENIPVTPSIYAGVFKGLSDSRDLIYDLGINLL